MWHPSSGKSLELSSLTADYDGATLSSLLAASVPRLETRSPARSTLAYQLVRGKEARQIQGMGANCSQQVEGNHRAKERRRKTAGDWTETLRQ
jgi:hypothetical protein